MKKKILYADDQHQNRLFVQLTLQPLNCEVIIVSSGKEALEKFVLEKPDLVLLDLYMPNMNGIQVMMEIRKIDKKVPVIAFTGAEFSSDSEEVKEMDFTDFLHKPIPPDELIDAIKRNLK